MMERWRELFPDAEAETRQRTFDELRDQYNHPRRYYHVFGHVARMLTMRDRYFPEAASVLDKAIFGHDAVYVASRQDNEERSADVMTALQRRSGDSDSEIAEVHRLIIITKRHITQPGDTAAEQLCDLDLLGLGLPAHKYQANTARIRKEFAFASDAQWATGRRTFIDSFLERPYVYATPSIRAEYETTARRNLAHERSQLA